MRYLRHAQYVFIAMLFVACTSMQVRLETPADYIGANYATIQAISNTVTMRVQAGLIPLDKAMSVHDRLRKIKTMTDTARDMLAGGMDIPETQMELLVQAHIILTQIEKELQERAR